jgi:rRNA maturation endonuclease Nob1
LSTGSIVGIVTGSVSAVATVLGLVFRVYKYKKKQRQQQLVQEGTPSIKETITRLCANCGSVTSTEFCTKCGARVTVR